MAPTTRSYPRTLHQAFPFGPSYGAAIERPHPAGERFADIVLAVAIGLLLTAAITAWWTS